MQTKEIFEFLKTNFPDINLELKEIPVDPYILVPADKLLTLCEFLYNDENLSFDSLVLQSGLDLADGKKVTLPDGTWEYEGGNLCSVYHLYSFKHNHSLVLKVIVPKDNPHVPSVEKIWHSAEYMERETYDVIGIIFDGHHDLRRILLPYDWEGHPLRKDYKVPEFYQGMKVPY